jgi:hypothetical protein
LREVTKVQGAIEEEDNRPDLERIRHLALNLLLLLTHYQSDSVIVEGPAQFEDARQTSAPGIVTSKIF